MGACALASRVRVMRRTFPMNIHEYQAKELFEKFGVPSPNGTVAGTAEEAKAAAETIGGDNLVIKAQIHAGGRGKGTFKNGFQGGVHLIENPDKAAEYATIDKALS